MFLFKTYRKRTALGECDKAVNKFSKKENDDLQQSRETC